MQLSWSVRRKLIYSSVTTVLALAIVIVVWVELFSAAPTCFDGKRDGTETGVDCGGSCSLVCAAAAHAPVVLWARAFPLASSTYTAVAYIQNNNPSAAARSVRYAFQLFDADNKLVVERDGVTDIPPVSTVPVVEPSIDVGSRKVARTLFSFADTPAWNTVSGAELPQLRISSQSLAPSNTRLDATVENTSLIDAPNVEVVAVLFDAQGVARAASKSLVPQIAGRSSSTVVFTWPASAAPPVGSVARTEITILPSF